MLIKSLIYVGMASKVVLVVLVLSTFVNSQHFGKSKDNYLSSCPRIYQKSFPGYIPKGNLTAGKLYFYDKESNVQSSSVFSSYL